MLPWAALLGTLGLNVSRHLRGRQTMCAFTRAHVPQWLFSTVFDIGADVLKAHVINGYPRS